MPIREHKMDFADLQQWVSDDPARALIALRIGKCIIDNGVRVDVVEKPNPTTVTLVNDTIARFLQENERLATDRLAVARENERLTADRKMIEMQKHIAMLETEHGHESIVREIEVLRGVNRELQTQLDETRKLVKQSTNSAKGQAGEETVERIARSVWPAADIQNTSTRAGMSDIHVVTKVGRIAIECKYKETIATDDVRKSIRDIEVIRQTHRDFIGYAFVSMRCASIPLKGNICFEFIGGTPVIWIGVVDNPRAITTSFVILSALIEGLRGSKETSVTDEGSLYEDVRRHVASIVSQQKIIGVLRDQIAGLQVIVDESMARFAPLLQAVEDDGLSCPKCHKKYVSKHYLVKHIERCGN